MNLSNNTVERLIKCRRELLKYQFVAKPHVYSSDLARVLNIRPEQLRQDLMATGIVSGNNRKGYDVNKLIAAIEETLKLEDICKVAFVGEPKLVTMFESFIESNYLEFDIEAIFSFTSNHDLFNGIPCFSFEQMPNKIKEKNIEIAVIAIDPELTKEIADSLQLCGIKGIINLSSENLGAIKGVQIENYDLLSVIEKLNFNIRSKI